eukprot:scaffold2729_cov403-Prasinococcus_capsulatus_cf.AAC.1
MRPHPHAARAMAGPAGSPAARFLPALRGTVCAQPHVPCWGYFCPMAPTLGEGHAPLVRVPARCPGRMRGRRTEDEEGSDRMGGLGGRDRSHSVRGTDDRIRSSTNALSVPRSGGPTRALTAIGTN